MIPRQGQDAGIKNLGSTPRSGEKKISIVAFPVWNTRTHRQRCPASGGGLALTSKGWLAFALSRRRQTTMPIQLESGLRQVDCVEGDVRCVTVLGGKEGGGIKVVY